jgi:hypothetical protein
VKPEDLHHHDVVHFAMDELKDQPMNGKEEEIIERLRQLVHNKSLRRQPPSS